MSLPRCLVYLFFWFLRAMPLSHKQLILTSPHPTHEVMDTAYQQSASVFCPCCESHLPLPLWSRTI